jgi:hypothetical protein
MPVVSVDKMWSRSTSDAKLSDRFRKLNMSFEEAYQVLHTVDTTQLEVYQANGLPAAGAGFPGFEFVLADNAKLTKVSPIMTIVTVSYSGEVGINSTGGSGAGGTLAPHPIYAPPKIDWDDVEVEEEVDEDFDGKPIVVDGTNEPIRGVRALFPDQTVTIRRNLPFFSPYIQARYRRSTNSDTFLGWPAGTAKLMKLSASNVSDPVIGYWEVTAQVQFRFPYRTTTDKAWYARIRNEGFYEVIDTSISSTAVVRAKDSNKQDVTKPILLDEFGYRITDPVNTFWRQIKLYDSLPYMALGLL